MRNTQLKTKVAAELRAAVTSDRIVIEALAEDPGSEEANDHGRWARNDFNAELFDPRAANAAMLRMDWNRWRGK